MKSGAASHLQKKTYAAAYCLGWSASTAADTGTYWLPAAQAGAEETGHAG